MREGHHMRLKIDRIAETAFLGLMKGKTHEPHDIGA